MTGSKIKRRLTGLQQDLFNRPQEFGIELEERSKKVTQPVVDRNQPRRSGLAALSAKRSSQIGLAVEAATEVFVFSGHETWMLFFVSSP